MLTLSQAQADILSRVKQASEVESVDLLNASNRFLACEQYAVVDNPAFDNSAMDGYALKTSDLDNTLTLPLKGESSCGQVPDVLSRHATMRIFTGAPLPAGADTVEIQENVTVDSEVGADTPMVSFSGPVTLNKNIRYRGEDFTAGQSLYKKGHRILPMDTGLLATAGIEKLSVFKRPRVLVIATGNELIAPGGKLKPGQIYESNRLVTLLQLRMLGMDAVDGGTVADDVDALKAKLALSTDYDFVITSGGASVGDHDLVKQVFSEIGAIDFWRVKIKPGKPVAFGLVGEKTHFFALPGNPVSSLVTFKLFVEPALYCWNHSKFSQLELNAVACNDFSRCAGRMEFLRARVFTENGVLKAEALSGQGSHMMGTIRHTNGLIRLNEDSSGFVAGDSISAIPLHLLI